MSFNSRLGGPFKSAWPNCIWQGSGAKSLTQAFANPLTYANGCGLAQPNFGFSSALVTQPNTLITHGQYMYTGQLAGTTVQFKVTLDPFSHISQYQFRTLVTGLSIAHTDKPGLWHQSRDALAARQPHHREGRDGRMAPPGVEPKNAMKPEDKMTAQLLP